MKTLLISMLAVMLNFSQPTETPLLDDGIPSLTAQFPGGSQAFFQYVNQNLNYPVIAKENCIEGKVFISFEITTDGNIQSVKVLKGIGFGCDDEAIEVVKNMPKWIPAQRAGYSINSRIVVPIKFRLI